MPLHHLLQDVCTPVNSVLHRGFMRGGTRVTESDPVNHTNHGERQKPLNSTRSVFKSGYASAGAFLIKYQPQNVKLFVKNFEAWLWGYLYAIYPFFIHGSCFFFHSRRPFEHVLVTLKYTHLRPLDITRPMQYARQPLERWNRCRSCCLCRSVLQKLILVVYFGKGGFCLPLWRRSARVHGRYGD